MRSFFLCHSIFNQKVEFITVNFLVCVCLKVKMIILFSLQSKASNGFFSLNAKLKLIYESMRVYLVYETKVNHKSTHRRGCMLLIISYLKIVNKPLIYLI